MIIIGISGRSGSGKSIISKIISEYLDAEVISFDQISHQVLEMGEYKDFVKNLVGNSVFDNDEINRKKLGNIIFNDKDKLSKINSEAEKLMNNIIDEKLTSTSSDYIIFDYALLPLSKYFKICDFNINVVAPEKMRFERLRKRENISWEYFLARENSLSNYDHLKFDYVLINDSTTEHLLKNIKKIAENIKFGGKNA